MPRGYMVLDTFNHGSTTFSVLISILVLFLKSMPSVTRSSHRTRRASARLGLVLLWHGLQGVAIKAHSMCSIESQAFEGKGHERPHLQ